MAFKGKPTTISADTTLVTMGVGLEGAVHGLQIGNNSSDNIKCEFKYFDSSNSSTTSFLITTVSGESTFTFEKPINLNSRDAIIASSSASNLVAISSVFEDSTVNLGVLSAAGQYTSTSTYNFGDLVTDGNGNTFLSTFDGNANRGISNSSAFQTFASKGDTGEVGISASQVLSGKSFSDSVNVSAGLTANTVSDADGNLRQVNQSGSIQNTGFTLGATNKGNYVRCSSTSALTINVVGGVFETGDIVSLFNSGTAAVISSNFCTLAGAEASTSVLTLATNGVGSILFLGSAEAVVTGNVS